MARGARRSRRRFGGALEKCSLIRAEVSPGRGELDRLGQAQIARGFPDILRDLSKMTLAGAGLELVREATPAREPDARLFDTTVSFLEALDGEDAGREELLLAFQTRVMSVVGFAPGLDVCARCGKRAPAGRAALFDPEIGAVVCRSCGGGPVRLSGGTRERLRRAASSAWLEVGREPWGGPEVEQSRALLGALVGHHLGRALAGAAVLSQIQALGGKAGHDRRG